MNAPLTGIRFFRVLEWLIFQTTGARPREDDLKLPPEPAEVLQDTRGAF